ncbi:orotidine 5'-phosphate decarboxylase [Anaerobacillus alkalidiazotrophicus]|uniref:Orotidine 5'-phosphate decarboxylase n=1 Tax=Anaerobacillus alkalidiazotrophicus TaxID=472963 RepID=A0A1S2LZ75_9BACI|nr:orotidine-5'-phosphate decarboxylase [Anaerobacillus alkalidiazotrophicus]OIJ17772.1 orotidine 5'-phosphate decarboxylase [Anaerobacillus alkalidiazotrophicus]
MNINKNPIIIALDYSEESQVWELIDKFDDEQLFLKVGMELYYSCGNNLLHKLKDKGHNIFLDLKLHDIPNTVGKAMKSLARLDVDIVNVHAAGGRLMMERALEGLVAGTVSGKERPMCIAVTQLTSTSQEVMQEQLKINGNIEDVVVHYAKLANESGLDGVVSSPLEVPLVKESCGTSFLTVTPGIRMIGDSKDDQQRITTPKQAKSLGSDFIVVGRSITASKNPLEAYLKIKNEWNDISETTIS